MLIWKCGRQKTYSVLELISYKIEKMNFELSNLKIYINLYTKFFDVLKPEFLDIG